MKATRVVVLALALAAAGCSSNSTGLTAPTNPPTISDPPITGTVPVGGSSFGLFVVTQTGDVQITLTQAGPPATITVGLGVGVPSAATCPLTITQGKVAASASPLDVGTLAAGNYCVQVFDVGNQAGPITFSLTVTHP